MESNVVNKLKEKFAKRGDQITIPLLRDNKTFLAELSSDGIFVDNLGSSPFLSWNVFIEAVELIRRLGGEASKGDAMGSKLGDVGLPINSVEGYVAHKIYGKEIGDSVFRRITPIACILVWADICINKPGQLVLNPNFMK